MSQAVRTVNCELPLAGRGEKRSCCQGALKEPPSLFEFIKPYGEYA